MQIFRQKDYRRAIKEQLLEAKKGKGRSVSFAALARLMRVQHTYLSTVLSGHGHLNSDQVFIASRYLSLSEKESQYLSLLHEHDRSIFPDRKLELKAKMQQLSSENLTTDAQVPSPVIGEKNSDAVTAFYLDVNAIFLHMFLTIDAYRRQPEKNRSQLHMTKASFESALVKCEKANLIARNAQGIQVLREDMHLPPTSPLFPAFRMAMRLKTLELLQNGQNTNDYTLTVLYSAKSETQTEIREKFLELLKWIQRRTQADHPEAVFQLNFDLLNWSR